MKGILVFLGVWSLFCLLSSCDDDSVMITSEKYLIFGHFYGFCEGEQCIEIFKLTEGELFEDQNDNYPDQESFYKGKFIKLSDEAFMIADGLMDAFPTQLLMENDKVIGLPDAGDWGGYYVEYKSGETHGSWLIDKIDDHIPEYLHAFTGGMDEVIDQLSN
jgi:hypothetical protein